MKVTVSLCFKCGSKLRATTEKKGVCRRSEFNYLLLRFEKIHQKSTKFGISTKKIYKANHGSSKK